MKNTQMIHSPRTFKIGLGLILAASLASMPVLTGASEREDAKAAAASKKLNELEKRERASAAATGQKTKAQRNTDSAKADGGGKTDQGGNKSRRTSAEDRARDRIGKFEQEARKIASRLSTSEKKTLLALINQSETGELAAIRGIGKSRSAAIEKARPIESIEALPEIKGVGLKTLEGVVDHGKSMHAQKKAEAKPARSKSD
ncbi:MAG: hypothetical protein ACR2RV_01145 [Verrucomicrobiales bacterium]